MDKPSFAVLAAVAVILLVSILLTGCKDRGECLESKRVQRIERTVVNGVTKSRTRWSSTCLQWQFPEGKPAK